MALPTPHPTALPSRVVFHADIESWDEGKAREALTLRACTGTSPRVPLPWLHASPGPGGYGRNAFIQTGQVLETGSHGEKRNCGQRDGERLGSSEVGSGSHLEVQADDRGSDLTPGGEMCLSQASALWSLCLLSWNLNEQESEQSFPLAGWRHHSAPAAAFLWRLAQPLSIPVGWAGWC